MKKSGNQCTGYKNGCDFYANNLAIHCDNCTADHLFKCQVSGVDICIHTDFKCNGIIDCMDHSDESVSQCPGCVDDLIRPSSPAEPVGRWCV